jgi:hypothetical protein
MSWDKRKAKRLHFDHNAKRLFWELMAHGGAIAPSSMFPELEHGFA